MSHGGMGGEAICLTGGWGGGDMSHGGMGGRLYVSRGDGGEAICLTGGWGGGYMSHGGMGGGGGYVSPLGPTTTFSCEHGSNCTSSNVLPIKERRRFPIIPKAPTGSCAAAHEQVHPS